MLNNLIDNTMGFFSQLGAQGKTTAERSQKKLVIPEIADEIAQNIQIKTNNRRSITQPTSKLGQTKHKNAREQLTTMRKQKSIDNPNRLTEKILERAKSFNSSTMTMH